MTRTAVIGGVDPTVGESVSRRFAREGDRVTLWARSESFTEQLAAELRAETPGDAVAVQVDMADPEAVQSGVETVHKAFGAIDVYVHNTPVPNWSGPLDDDPASLRTTFDTVGYGFCSWSTNCCRICWTVVFNTGDFVKWVAREMAEQLVPEGVHAVHVFVDGWVDDEAVDESVPDEKRADPDKIAAEFLQLVEQDRDVWTFDIDFRPWGSDAFRTRR